MSNDKTLIPSGFIEKMIVDFASIGDVRFRLSSVVGYRPVMFQQFKEDEKTGEVIATDDIRYILEIFLDKKHYIKTEYIPFGSKEELDNAVEHLDFVFMNPNNQGIFLSSPLTGEAIKVIPPGDYIVIGNMRIDTSRIIAYYPEILSFSEMKNAYATGPLSALVSTLASPNHLPFIVDFLLFVNDNEDDIVIPGVFVETDVPIRVTTGVDGEGFFIPLLVEHKDYRIEEVYEAINEILEPVDVYLGSDETSYTDAEVEVQESVSGSVGEEQVEQVEQVEREQKND